MNQLYPIIRRARRSLWPVDDAMPPARGMDEAQEPEGAVPVPRDEAPSAPEPEPLNKRANSKTVSKTA